MPGLTLETLLAYLWQTEPWEQDEPLVLTSTLTRGNYTFGTRRLRVCGIEVSAQEVRLEVEDERKAEEYQRRLDPLFDFFVNELPRRRRQEPPAR